MQTGMLFNMPRKTFVGGFGGTDFALIKLLLQQAQLLEQFIFLPAGLRIYLFNCLLQLCDQLLQRLKQRWQWA
jgi:hypothetical protein